MALRVRDLSRDDGTVYYHYRGKGGKTGRRELPNPAYAAIVRALAAWGRELTTMSPEDSLWPGRGSRGISSGTFYGRLQTYLAQAGLPPAGVHLFRHTAAKLRRDTGATIEEVSQFLDHSNLGVTSVYLRRLETPHDAGWADVAALLGVEHHASDREAAPRSSAPQHGEPR